MLSICTTVKNRSRVEVEGRVLHLFPNCVRSIAAAVPEDQECELIVADWDSDDWPLEEWIEAAAGSVPVTVERVEGEFSRGRGRNVAARRARGRYLCFLDADCLVPSALFLRGLEVLDTGKVFFPVLYSFSDYHHRDGWWRHQGYGNAMLDRDSFDAVGGFPAYPYWGREDVDFFERLLQCGEVVREEVPGFYHQWHPDDFDWKNRYGEPSPHESRKRFEETMASRIRQGLTRTAGPQERIAIVGAAELPPSLLADFCAMDPNERDGLDWGPPADSREAIERIEQARQAGARLLAFPWTAFWWIDHYQGLARYLEERYERILEEEHVVVFALGERGSENP